MNDETILENKKEEIDFDEIDFDEIDFDIETIYKKVSFTSCTLSGH